MRFITKKTLPRRTVLRGLGAAVALPLLDANGPPAHGVGADARDAGAAARVRLHPERGGDERRSEPLEAGRRGHGLRVLVHPDAPRPLPGPPDDRERPLAAFRGGGSERRCALARGRRLVERHRRQAGARRERAGRDDGRSGRRGRAGAGYAAALAGAGDRQLQQQPGRQLRQRLRLRLPQHARVAHADHPAAHGAAPGRGLRAPLRRRGHGGPAAGGGTDGPEHPRRRDRGHRRPAADGGGQRPCPRRRVPRFGARDRAPLAGVGTRRRARSCRRSSGPLASRSISPSTRS